MSKTKPDKIEIIIDNKPYRVKAGMTILQAAEQNGIYLPTLCSHPSLSPHGGCRLCIVEVEGMRTFPTACTTPVSPGMLIRTHTEQIQRIRREILQLFMSEHPSSCLICDERQECRDYSITIHKAGVTTGCRYCPNDGQCEFQELVEYLEIKEIEYPIYYRNLPVEKEDPFYDRDYNLCVLCGRCIRMCQEVRLANVLAFKHRGRETVLGPAYQRSHLEAGCEFCGACVSVCPTGTLAEKARKWEGPPEAQITTTCPFCGVGCQLQLLIRNNRVIGSLPAEDALVNRGQLCVKGRFCIPELLNHNSRLEKPYRRFDGINYEIGWEQALETAAEKLSACSPEEFAMVLSPNLLNEDLYIAQKFAREVIKSNRIDNSARQFYGAAINEYLDLMQRAAPLSQISRSEVLLCLGLDTRFGRSVVGVELRRALQKGARIVTLHSRRHSLSLNASKWLQPQPGQESEALAKLLHWVRKLEKNPATGTPAVAPDEKDIAEAARILSEGKSALILLGSELLQHREAHQILKTVATLAETLQAAVLPLPPQNNFYGSLLMGAFAEILPGGKSAVKPQKTVKDLFRWEALLETADSGNPGQPPPRVLYLIGENLPPQINSRPEFIIYQNIFMPEADSGADLLLPAAAFSESEGSCFNGAGRLQRVRRAVAPPEKALPDWEILCRLARLMGASGFEFRNVKEVFEEISAVVPRFKNFARPSRHPEPLSLSARFTLPEPDGRVQPKTNGQYRYQLNALISEHSHRGVLLSQRVDGARVIFGEGILHMHPEDARRHKIEAGESVEVISPAFRRVWPVCLDADVAAGNLHIWLPPQEYPGPNPHPVKIRKKHV
ncbi:MAG: formate dehydrogenase subunit alpha [Calditrichia bacterium]